MSDDTGPPDSGVEDPSAAEQRTAVRERYGDIADDSGSCCSGDGTTADSSDVADADDEELARRMGYSGDDLDAVPSDANMGLGCGNPTALASLEAEETVLDLGSGGGFDCFLAADEVGADGRVIGVDMTPEMVEKARENATGNDADNVEFRLGEIEHLPVADGSVDVIISNCVVNLSPDKPRVFDEAFRVLRPGGRLAISDVVLTAELPPAMRTDLSSVSGCVGGASRIAELESMLAEAGFEDVSIDPKEESEEFIREWSDERDLSDYVVSATIEGRKPTDA